MGTSDEAPGQAPPPVMTPAPAQQPVMGQVAQGQPPQPGYPPHQQQYQQPQYQQPQYQQPPQQPPQFYPQQPQQVIYQQPVVVASSVTLIDYRNALFTTPAGACCTYCFVAFWVVFTFIFCAFSRSAYLADNAPTVLNFITVDSPFNTFGFTVGSDFTFIKSCQSYGAETCDKQWKKMGNKCKLPDDSCKVRDREVGSGLEGWQNSWRCTYSCPLSIYKEKGRAMELDGPLYPVPANCSMVPAIGCDDFVSAANGLNALSFIGTYVLVPITMVLIAVAIMYHKFVGFAALAFLFITFMCQLFVNINANKLMSHQYCEKSVISVFQTTADTPIDDTYNRYTPGSWAYLWMVWTYLSTLGHGIGFAVTFGLRFYVTNKNQQILRSSQAASPLLT